MRNRSTAHREFAKERLNVTDRGLTFVASSRIADVTDTDVARKGLKQLCAGKVIADIAHATRRVETVLCIVHHDPASLLAAVLQGMEAKGDKVGRIGNADNAENPALLL